MEFITPAPSAGGASGALLSRRGLLKAFGGAAVSVAAGGLIVRSLGGSSASPRARLRPIASNKPIKRYKLVNAWASSLEIGSLKAGDTSVLTEKLTVTYEQIEVE